MKKLWQNKWFRAAVIALPFTSIINPAWCVALIFTYFIIGGRYLFFDD